MDWIVAPDGDGRALADVLPSVLAAMGVHGVRNTVGVPPARNVVVFLVDGLGWDLLREHPADAPFLASHATGSPGKAGFPTTTVTSIASLGTGRCAGEHGLVGYSFAEPSGGLLHPLSWSTHATARRTSLLTEWPPEDAQPEPTALQRAAGAGVDVRVAAPHEFEGTGLTRAALRGGTFRGVRALGDLAAEMADAALSPGPTLCYAYHGHLDLLGHVHGPGSVPWRLQLAQIDRLVESVADRLPTSTVLLVVADHGMVEVDPGTLLDADTEPALREGVHLLGGEVRARHVYVEQGAADDVFAAWTATIGGRGHVLTRDEAIDEGWFGPVVTHDVRARIGDVIAVMREQGIARSLVEPGESRLRGHHGSLTAAEQYVPLLTVEG
jgi:hypothetical protein